MAQSRSLYKEIFRNFIDSITFRQLKYKLVGRDYLGTEYFESLKSPHKKRQSRWFTPVQPNNIEQDIPPEWQAWLRHKRKDPPTDEEIQINLAKMRQTIENAKKLEKPPMVSKDEIKTFDKPSFPKYEDYGTEPTLGRNKNSSD